MYILDTNVVSEIGAGAKGDRRANPKVLEWARSVPVAALFLSATTVLELEVGVLRLERRNKRQGKALRDWLDDKVIPAFADRILPIDTIAARRCAKLHVPNPRPDRDALIGATALSSGMTVVTRNVADFAAMRVATLNPWLAA